MLFYLLFELELCIKQLIRQSLYADPSLCHIYLQLFMTTLYQCNPFENLVHAFGNLLLLQGHGFLYSPER